MFYGSFMGWFSANKLWTHGSIFSLTLICPLYQSLFAHLTWIHIKGKNPRVSCYGLVKI